MKCPHCGLDIHPPSEFRERLAKLADGTRTTQEIAQIVGRPLTVVNSTLSNMKKKGINVIRKPIEDPNKEKRKIQIVSDRFDGMTYKNIGIKHGISTDTARQIFVKQQGKLLVLDAPPMGNANEQ